MLNVTEDRTVYAAYIATVRCYTITFYDRDGTTTLETKQVAYGDTPSYTPTKDGYDFAGWNPALATVTGDTSYSAAWTEKATFATLTWAEIAEISEAGQATEYFAVGDKRAFAMTFADGTTEDGELEIIGFDHDTLSDGSGTAGITLALVGVVNTMGTVTNEENNSYGILQTNVLPYLPEDLKAVMKTVTKKLVPTTSVQSTATSIFSLAMVEIGYSTIKSAEGSRYAKYLLNKSDSSNVYKELKKYNNAGDSVAWALRTQYSTNGYGSEYYVDYDGSRSYGLPGIKTRYYSFCVCV